MLRRDLPRLKYFLTAEAVAKGAHFEAPRLGDAGFDLRAIDTIVLEGNQQATIATGLHLAIPEGWVGIVKDRSSMASKRVYTHGGVIDAGYRGEVKVVISNQGDQSYHIEAGAKIAQLLLVPCLTLADAVTSIDALGTTDRGAGGFGSTGK